MFIFIIFLNLTGCATSQSGSVQANPDWQVIEPPLKLRLLWSEFKYYYFQREKGPLFLLIFCAFTQKVNFSLNISISAFFFSFVSSCACTLILNQRHKSYTWFWAWRSVYFILFF